MRSAVGLTPPKVNRFGCNLERCEHAVFVGLVVSRLLYALPAWGVLVSAAQVGRINAFLKRVHKWGFCKDVVTLNELLIKSGSSLFHKCSHQYAVLTHRFNPKRKPTISLETDTALIHYHSAILMLLGINCQLVPFYIVTSFLSFVRVILCVCVMLLLSLHCISFNALFSCMFVA